MVDATEAMESKFLSVQFIRDIEIEKRRGTILDEGSYEETDYGKKLTVTVEINGSQKIWRLNKDSAHNIGSMHGKDTKQWVGKPLAFQLVKVAGKDCVIASPLVNINRVPVENVRDGA